jgi:hypothetical protein
MTRLAPLLLFVLALTQSAPAVGATWRLSDVTAGTGLAAVEETWTADAIDYDGDGLQDIWIGYHDQGGKLWRNDGDGTLTWVAPTDARGEERHRAGADAPRSDQVLVRDRYLREGLDRGDRTAERKGRNDRVGLRFPSAIWHAWSTRSPTRSSGSARSNSC